MISKRKSRPEREYHRHISARHKFFKLEPKKILAYKDLIVFYARKNIVTSYRQTVLGPIWLVLSPLLNSLIQMFVFGYLAGFKTGGVPKIVFYLFSNTAWQLYSYTVNGNSQLLLNNARLFEKVFFPRLTISYANMLSNVITTGVQLILSFCFLLIYWALGEVTPAPTFILFVIPIALLLMLGQGMGLIYASLAVRYRDLKNVFPIVTSVLMYFSPVVYPLSQLGTGALGKILLLNPFCAIFELFRAFLWNAPYPPLWSIIYAVVMAILVDIFGILIFNRVGRNFVDTI